MLADPLSVDTAGAAYADAASAAADASRAVARRPAEGRAVNYRTAVAAVRSKRNRETLRLMHEHWRALDEIRAQARQEIAELRSARDAEIHRLRGLGFSIGAIAAELGCNREQVAVALDPSKREAYNERRRTYWDAWQRRQAENTRLSSAAEKPSKPDLQLVPHGARIPVADERRTA